MRADDAEFVCDTVAKFFHTTRLEGWFVRKNDPLVSVNLIGEGVRDAISQVGLVHKGVANLGSQLGFSIQFMHNSTKFMGQLELEFRTRAGKRIAASLNELAEDRINRYESPKMLQHFIEQINGVDQAKLLDIGGRARSGLDHSTRLPLADVTVFDVCDGENVDVVGDAHELRRFVSSNYFDAVFACSVFEHLIMPWTTVTEINRVLKQGGLVLVGTHQTLGLHDAPWDYWRFSESAWDALFNKHTGFEIIERVQDCEQYIVPFVYSPRKEHAEKSAGFEVSMVLARKTGPCRVSWPLTASDVVETSYPTNADNAAG